MATVSNAEVANVLLALAQLLSTQKENPFKVRAYRRAAKAIANTAESVAKESQSVWADLSSERAREIAPLWINAQISVARASTENGLSSDARRAASTERALMPTDPSKPASAW